MERGRETERERQRRDAMNKKAGARPREEKPRGAGGRCPEAMLALL